MPSQKFPLSHFHVNYRGTGSEQYPPAMMLALLIHGCAPGRFGSRTIEAATCSDVAVRYLCANTHPVTDSICAFRAAHAAAFRAAFVSVLQLARQLRLTRVGTGSVDETKLQAHASKHAAVSYERAGQAQARETPESLDLPAEWVRREKRVAVLQQARHFQSSPPPATAWAKRFRRKVL